MGQEAWCQSDWLGGCHIGSKNACGICCSKRRLDRYLALLLLGGTTGYLALLLLLGGRLDIWHCCCSGRRLDRYLSLLLFRVTTGYLALLLLGATTRHLPLLPRATCHCCCSGR